MRSVVVGFGSLYLCIIVFVICAMIQINANTTIEITYAANEAAYQSMIALMEDDTISTDEQFEQEFVKNAGIMLEGSSRFQSEEGAEQYHEDIVEDNGE